MKCFHYQQSFTLKILASNKYFYFLVEEKLCSKYIYLLALSSKDDLL